MSDTYYVRAYHKDKRINIPIEEKHKYIMDNGNIAAINKLSSTYNVGEGYQLNANACDIIWWSNLFRLEQGNDGEERIGDKVQIRNIDMTLNINWNVNLLKKFYQITDNDHFAEGIKDSSNNVPAWINMRLMCVQFDDPLTGDTGYPIDYPDSDLASNYSLMKYDFVNWFRATYIYYKRELGAGSNEYIHQSVHQQKLRESTPWTGTFKILYDKKFKLKTNEAVQTEYILNLNKNVNVDSDNRITHESMKNIYWVLLGPAFNDVDISPNLRVMLSTAYDGQNSITATTLTNEEANFKVTYYDL